MLADHRHRTDRLRHSRRALRPLLTHRKCLFLLSVRCSLSTVTTILVSIAAFRHHFSTEELYVNTQPDSKLSLCKVWLTTRTSCGCPENSVSRLEQTEGDDTGAYNHKQLKRDWDGCVLICKFNLTKVSILILYLWCAVITTPWSLQCISCSISFLLHEHHSLPKPNGTFLLCDWKLCVWGRLWTMSKTGGQALRVKINLYKTKILLGTKCSL